jgi:CPA1 family monovalent cation:H+ antiporter
MVFGASLFASKTRIPYTMMLVAIGIALSIFNYSSVNDIAANLRIDPKLIIDFIVPPLIFEAMMKVDYQRFKQIRISAFLLATVGVVIATLAGGFLLMYIAGLPFFVAFAFSALIAPTDAAMVIEVFKRVKVPHLLSTLMESESSFNDATAIIAFSSIIALAAGSGSSSIMMADTTATTSSLAPPSANVDTTGLAASISPPSSSSPHADAAIASSFDLVGETERFAIVFFGGAGIGLAIAAGAHRLHALMDDPFSEVALTVASVFGAVIVANSLEVSGLVAVAVVGLYFGNVTIRHEKAVSQKVRESAFSFWEMAAFFANSAAFLYLGVTMNLPEIGARVWLIALAFGAVMAARAVSVYPILYATNRFTKEKIPPVWRNVVFLGGMRGAVSVALVASLPAGEFKVILESITFGVVLSSLVLQYVMLSGYIKKKFAQQSSTTTATEEASRVEK